MEHYTAVKKSEVDICALSEGTLESTLLQES